MPPSSTPNTEERTSEQDMRTLMMGKTSAVVGSIWIPNYDVKSHSTECPFARAQCMLLLSQHMWIDLPLYMYKLILDEAWSVRHNSIPYDVFLT